MKGEQGFVSLQDIVGTMQTVQGCGVMRGSEQVISMSKELRHGWVQAKSRPSSACNCYLSITLL